MEAFATALMTLFFMLFVFALIFGSDLIDAWRERNYLKYGGRNRKDR